MLISKHTHACVRLADGDRLVLVDPGIWTEPEAYDDITDILLTHDHIDHFDLARVGSLLGSRDLRIHAPESVRAAALAGNAPAVAAAVHVVEVGDTFTAGGFEVTAVGGRHAEIYDGIPDCANLGYLVEGVYHPGDSFFVPAQPVETLLVPISGPWSSLRGALDFTRAVAPARAFPIHDRMLSTDIGFDYLDDWMREAGRTDYNRIPLGGSVEV
jgi:L-ascorbate metabolism protein UlaG (beta-lactamase superfamily)